MRRVPFDLHQTKHDRSKKEVLFSAFPFAELAPEPYKNSQGVVTRV